MSSPRHHDTNNRMGGSSKNDDFDILDLVNLRASDHNLAERERQKIESFSNHASSSHGRQRRPSRVRRNSHVRANNNNNYDQDPLDRSQERMADIENDLMKIVESRARAALLSNSSKNNNNQDGDNSFHLDQQEIEAKAAGGAAPQQQRSRPVVDMQQPGAYAGTLDHGYQRQEKMENLSHSLVLGSCSDESCSDDSCDGEQCCQGEDNRFVGRRTPTNGEEFNKEEGDPQKTAKQRPKRPMVLLVAGVVLLLLLLAIIVPIVVVVGSGSVNQDSSTYAPTYTDAPLRTGIDPALVPNITEATLKAINDDLLSPQGLAYEWCADDPKWDTFEDWRKQQRFVMACLVHSVKGGTAIFSMNHFVDECQWMKNGECTKNQEGRITALLYDSALGAEFGVVPAEIGFLSRLERWEMVNVDVHRGTLENLLPRNTLENFPSSIRHLGLRDMEDLHGSRIPSTLGLLTSLVSLDLGGNGLASGIPSELALLSNLTSLVLSDNQLTGTIPEELSSLDHLEFFSTHQNSNGLETQLPSGFCTPNRVALWEDLQTDWCLGSSECCTASP